MTPPAAPDVISIGPPRLTAGLDRLRRIDLDGFTEIFGTLPRLTAAQLIEAARQVDLRGRGGAAFPVAGKLAAVRAAASSRRRTPVIVINGTETDPGSAKDVVLLRRSPYLVLGGALTAATALRAKEIVVAVSDSLAAQSVRQAAAAQPALARLVTVAEVPDRFIAGESSTLISALAGRDPIPSERAGHASDSGVRNRPTLLSNAETYAQLAFLALAGPARYAEAGTAEEPGTILLTVGGAVSRPAVVEVPAGVPLGEVLSGCGAPPVAAVLAGGYHGGWLPPAALARVPVSRAGLARAGSTLGPGVVLVLGPDSCPLGEVAQVAAYLAKESCGQCGPCRHGLPAVARSLAALANGSGGSDALEVARRGAAAAQAPGVCSHPDGVFGFVLSALELFTEDTAAHLFRGGCGRPVLGYLPVPVRPEEVRLAIDWTRCQGHGRCAQIVPELIQLDGQGYPVLLDMPVPAGRERDARQAVGKCPVQALRLVPAAAEPPAAVAQAGQVPAQRDVAAGDTVADLTVSEDWIADIAVERRARPGQQRPR
jgi:NADH:ubiquinone oxidoreductase subunit F (NADH-binding)/ferredoxin